MAAEIALIDSIAMHTWRRTKVAPQLIAVGRGSDLRAAGASHRFVNGAHKRNGDTMMGRRYGVRGTGAVTVSRF